MPVKEQDEEYEIIPVSPLRKLEKRMEQLETTTPTVDTKEIFREVVDVMRMNQQIVNELSKANDAMRLELSKLVQKLEDLTNNLNELISYIKAAAVEEAPQAQETTGHLAQKINELVDANKKIVESNQTVLSVLDEMEKHIRRPILSLPPRKPLPPKMV
jgi:ABC-type transporter Mla subunit MlaD